eukprot:383639-Rhodomonas_salina.1
MMAFAVGMLRRAPSTSEYRGASHAFAAAALLARRAWKRERFGGESGSGGAGRERRRRTREFQLRVGFCCCPCEKIVVSAKQGDDRPRHA